MKTLLEVRVLEKWAAQQYGSTLGTPISNPGQTPFVRKIVLEAGDPRLADLKERLDKDHDKPAVLIQRQYDATELLQADLFHLIITECFNLDVCGEDYGTQYDDSSACSICGKGRIQISPLRLDLSLAPSGIDIARTIALNEVVVSERFVELIEGHHFTGCRVQAIEHVGKKKSKGRWYQLIVTGSVGPSVAPTRYGISYFDDDVSGAYTCREHLLSGLHILSEIYLKRAVRETYDLALTDNRIGRRSGVLMPTPLMVASRRCYELITKNHVTGCRFEIARLVE